MLPLSIFRSLNICIAQYGMFVSGIIMIVMFYFVAIFMIIVMGLSSTNAGVQLIYFAPGLGVGSILQISMVKCLRQPKYPIVAGSLIMTVALGLLSMGVERNNKGMIDGHVLVLRRGHSQVHLLS
ncbi:hypothetical protein AcW1_003284 [Taiwanofungus camphoratus]|nr:hypothetical protein AcW1_003284 [Antrodia cinnamomea]